MTIACRFENSYEKRKPATVVLPTLSQRHVAPKKEPPRTGVQESEEADKKETLLQPTTRITQQKQIKANYSNVFNLVPQ